MDCLMVYCGADNMTYQSKTASLSWSSNTTVYYTHLTLFLIKDQIEISLVKAIILLLTWLQVKNLVAVKTTSFLKD